MTADGAGGSEAFRGASPDASAVRLRPLPAPAAIRWAAAAPSAGGALGIWPDETRHPHAVGPGDPPRPDNGRRRWPEEAVDRIIAALTKLIIRATGLR